MSAHYDDPKFSYLNYWQGRDYEHAAELLALTKLLSDTKLSKAADIGGGYGRLIPFLKEHARTAFLVEPSLKQRNLAKKFLVKFPKVAIISGTAEKTKFPPNSLDLVVMVRVMHHLTSPQSAVKELHRILKPNGLLILEYANSLHFKARIISFLTGQPILPIPLERRSQSNIDRQTIAFVNHHPFSVKKVLFQSGFKIEKVLSVSNFRSPLLKKILPIAWLIWAEDHTQKLLSSLYFGPSIFVLAKKS